MIDLESNRCILPDGKMKSGFLPEKSIFALGLKRQWDATTLMHVFTHQYPLPNQTLFEGVHHLEPGYCLTVMGNECTIRSYWDIEYPYEKRSADEFMPALQRSIARRLRADCKRSVYLSGGIDSATILA